MYYITCIGDVSKRDRQQKVECPCLPVAYLPAGRQAKVTRPLKTLMHAAGSVASKIQGRICEAESLEFICDSGP